MKNSGKGNNMIEDENDDHEYSSTAKKWKEALKGINNDCMASNNKGAKEKESTRPVSARAKTIIVRTKSGKRIYNSFVTIEEFNKLIRPLFETLELMKDSSSIEYKAY